MTSVSAMDRVGSERATGRLERLLAAMPLVTIFVWAALLYVWQAWLHGTPFIFTDELELTQLSRSFAETGHAARRGEPQSITSLTVLLTAPAWLIQDTTVAYEALKYAGAVAMTAAIFPTYALARMLVPRPLALFAAAASVAVPAFAYSPLLLEEPFAYPAATFGLYAIVRALAAPTRGTLAVAVLASVLAPLIRTQLAVLPVVFALAGLAVFWVSPRGSEWRARWTRWDAAGAVVLVVGLLIVLNELVAHASQTWEISTRYYKDRIVEYGLWAGGAFTIGIGVLPVVVGLAGLRRPIDEPRSPERFAFAAVLAASLVAFGVYAAVKAAFLSTNFATRIAERNLIYLAPLLLVATALWLHRPRLRLLALGLATAFVALLLVTVPIVLDYPYFEAPGYALLALANRELALSAGTIEWLLLVVLAVSVLFAVAPRALGRAPRAVGPALGLAAALVLAWNVTGQTYVSAGFRNGANVMLESLPKPLDWVDEATGRTPTMYLGQKIKDANGIWLTEFWNRSIDWVWSLDGSAPGPGGTATPDIQSLDGALQQQRFAAKYVLADEGIEIVGPLVASRRTSSGNLLRLYRVDYPIRLRRAIEGVYPDGWTGESASYTQYSTAGDRPGWTTVVLSREGWGGLEVTARAEVRVGKAAIDQSFHPTIGTVTERRGCLVRSGGSCRFVIPTPAPPFRVEVRISPTFVPAKVAPGNGDTRELGAVARFSFSERRSA